MIYLLTFKKNPKCTSQFGTNIRVIKYICIGKKYIHLGKTVPEDWLEKIVFSDKRDLTVP